MSRNHRSMLLDDGDMHCVRLSGMQCDCVVFLTCTEVDCMGVVKSARCFVRSRLGEGSDQCCAELHAIACLLVGLESL